MILKTSSSRSEITIGFREWCEIGRKAGWTVVAETVEPWMAIWKAGFEFDELESVIGREATPEQMQKIWKLQVETKRALSGIGGRNLSGFSTPESVNKIRRYRRLVSTVSRNVAPSNAREFCEEMYQVCESFAKAFSGTRAKQPVGEAS